MIGKTRSKVTSIAIYVCIAFIIFVYIQPLPTRPSSVHQRPLSSLGLAANCQTDGARLRKLRTRHDLTRDFEYVRRRIHFTRQSGIQRSSLTKLSQRLVSTDFDLVQANYPDSLGRFNTCPGPIQIPVTASVLPKDVNASDFMFGVSTTFGRFVEYSDTLLSDWSYWLTDGAGRSNGAKLILMLLDASEKELKNAKMLLHQAGIDAETYPSDSSLAMAARNMALIPTMYNHSLASTKKWLVLCDDDTFFPNMHALTQKLHSFDDSRDMYIGAVSEDGFAVQKHGKQAFGGAGVFLSLPAAEKVARRFGSCAAEESLLQAGWQGDRLLHQCILNHTSVDLTIIRDLWQLDLFNDPSGFYEWGSKPLSIHHYRSWHHANPADLTKIAYICGEDCTLQRFQTLDDFIISGYSIAQYPQGITFNASEIEKTFDSEQEMGWNFNDKMDRQRQSLSKTGKKLAWSLVDAVFQEDGTLLQTYVRKANDARWVDGQGRPLRHHDGVIELVWAKAP